MYSLQSTTNEEQMYIFINLELLLAKEGSIFLGWKSKGRYPSSKIFP
jgi:hypothetical protein